MYRWLIAGILLCAVVMSGYFRRRARAEGGAIPRTDEGRLLVVLRALVTLPLLGGILAYLVDPAWMSWAELDAPGWLRPVGAVLGIVSVLAIYWVLDSLGTNISETVLTKPDHELVRLGPYRWVRHPLYATGLCLFFGVGLMAANVALLAMVLLVALMIRYVVIPREEAALEARFGDEYRRYGERTGRLLPRLFTRS